MRWLFILPAPLFLLLCVVAFVILGMVGYYVTKPIVRMLMGGSFGGTDGIINAVTRLYGLILALMAVAVWQNFQAADASVSKEASALRSLYRDFDEYSEPDRSMLTMQLRDYTKYVIDEEWPAQQRGVFPSSGSGKVSALQRALFALTPKSDRDKLIQESAIGEFRDFSELRALRVQAITEGMPSALWVVILLGAFLTIVSTYFRQLEPVRAQLTMTSFVSAIIAIIIFITAEMDYPFQGQVSVPPDAFRIVYNWMTRQ